MLKVIFCTVGLALIALVHFAWRGVPDHYGFEYADDEAPTARKTVAEVKELRAGTRIYISEGTKRPFGIVVAEEAEHEFGDGKIDPRVLIEFKAGTQFWLRREHLGKCYIYDVKPVGE